MNLFIYPVSVVSPMSHQIVTIRITFPASSTHRSLDPVAPQGTNYISLVITSQDIAGVVLGFCVDIRYVCA